MKPSIEQERLIAEAKQNITDVRQGLASLTPTAHLAAKYGYTPNGAKQLLRRVGLNTERMIELNEKLSIPFPPTRELAWLIGYFSEHGSPNLNRIAVTDEDQERRRKFSLYSNLVFNHNPTPLPDTTKNNTVLFIYSKEIVSRLGDISQKNYPNTLIERYKWLFDDQKFAWGFLEGLFDSKAYIADKRITINSKYEALIDHIIAILNLVGVNNPTKNLQGNNNIWALNIQREKDLRVIAKNIKLVSTVSTNKDALLKKYRPHRAHHWKIDSPNGPTSIGTCITCGEQRVFKNSVEDEEFRRYNETPRKR